MLGFVVKRSANRKVMRSVASQLKRHFGVVQKQVAIARIVRPWHGQTGDRAEGRSSARAMNTSGAMWVYDNRRNNVVRAARE